jgi:hypothetical protein
MLERVVMILRSRRPTTLPRGKRLLANQLEAIKIAGKYVRTFGIATECGIARACTPDLVKSIIDIHAAISKEPASS